MYVVLFSVLTFLSTCNCVAEKDEHQDHCAFLKQWFESSVSVELSKKGFHREVITTVEPKPGSLGDVRVLLVYRWTSGVYVDPYQVASLRDQSDWQILLDSGIDLEAPAHKTSGFLTYVYPSYNGLTSSLLKVTLPVHGRYHKPSLVGKTFTSLHIEPPELLLWTAKCKQLNRLEPHTVVAAPCTFENSSSCSWVKIHHRREELGPLSFQLPVGDGSVVTPVCGATLLVTTMCCVALTKHMWKHRII
ncbi:phosphatidylinositol-glycan biosynthesis class X protein [Cololabis saira]|uniref:phosphatidylinositol-glycan biosynthesis class X protein n=1 Tax=Cololabis saira TaxID=129043 RepID=UPI002AD2BCD4|nr:phosphatidylinositol-glycan biosynthesis class X protein [Cololabis saira]